MGRTASAAGIILDSTNDHKRDGLSEPFVFTMGDQCTCAALTPRLARSIRCALGVSPSALPCGWVRRRASCRPRLDHVDAPFFAAGSVGRGTYKAWSLTLTLESFACSVAGGLE